MSSAPGMIEDVITLSGREVRYRIRRSTRAQRMSMRVLPGVGLEVVLPRGFTLREASTLVRKNQRWVLRSLDRMARAKPPVELIDGALLPFAGETLTLAIVQGGSRNSAKRTGDTLTVTITDGTLPVTAIETWYRTQARKLIAERAAFHATSLGVTFGRISIKDTRSRWGSCSSKGNLNFSWRLILAPAEVLDYVVAHEVAHLRELNHSPAFWAHVETLCPDFKTHRAWLRRHGRDLAAWPG